MNLVELIWEYLLNLSGRWDFVATLFALTVLINRFRRIRRFASALIFPSSLLLVRKLALYVPVSGAISSEDQVIFWSATAYWYFLALIILHILIIVGVRYRKELAEGEGGAGCVVFFVAPIGLFIGSKFLLPIGLWWNHIYMPVVSLLGVTKILIINPFLAPIAWGSLFIQMGLVLFAGGKSGREINKLALICVLLSGLTHFGLQAAAPPAPIVPEIRRSWDETGRTQDFISVWAAKLPEIFDLGVNVVERRVPYLPNVARGQVISKMTPPWNEFWSEKHTYSALLGGLVLILLLVLIERLGFGGGQDLVTPGRN